MIQSLTRAQIHSFLGWKYDEPYAIYNMSGDDPQEALAFFSDPANGYFAIVGEGDELLGFCNFGADARVSGGDYDEENGVCYLQILVADEIPGFGRARMMQDMDSWGYSFRLGTTRAWFRTPADLDEIRRRSRRRASGDIDCIHLDELPLREPVGDEIRLEVEAFGLKVSVPDSEITGS